MLEELIQVAKEGWQIIIFTHDQRIKTLMQEIEEKHPTVQCKTLRYKV